MCNIATYVAEKIYLCRKLITFQYECYDNAQSNFISFPRLPA